MNLLAIETSSRSGSVALLCGDSVSERLIESPRDQTAFVLQFTHDLLGESGIGLDRLDAIVFGRGPGSFTGIRLAIAVAQGLAMAHALPLVGVSSLGALARAAWQKHGVTRCVACIDARMGEVYWGDYTIEDGIAHCKAGEQIGPPEAVPLPAFGPWLAVGDGYPAFELLRERAAGATAVLSDISPAAADLLPEARRAVESGQTVDPAAAQPAYLRGKSAWRRDFPATI